MPSPEFSYAQARMQARHGSRPGDAEWQALDAARSFEQYLERTRSGGLAGFTERIGPGDDSHTIELRLREAWRGYVGDVAHWAPRSWQAAVRWCAVLPDVPVLAHLLDGGAALPWMATDPVIGALAGMAPEARREHPAALGLAPRAGSGGGATGGSYGAWLRHWRSLWPACRAGEIAPVERLIAAVRRAFNAIADAETVAAGDELQRRLALRVKALFRSATAGPGALFCHLILVALDVERLRGGLLRRRLLGDAMAEAA